MQAFVPTADEIYADKVFALGARDYLKPRDVFDIDWICSLRPGIQCKAESLRIRLLTYPNTSPKEWLARAEQRLEQLPGSMDVIGKDLKRWLPAYYPLDEAAVSLMISRTAEALNNGKDEMLKLLPATKVRP